MTFYLTRTMRDDEAEWSVIYTDGRVHVTTYRLYSELNSPYSNDFEWIIETYRQFRIHRAVKFETQELALAFIARRIKAASGQTFQLKPEDLLREDRW